MLVHELERQIAAKERELQAVQGRETEIYTRIVGYYRSLKNWNRGKKEEYRLRRTYDVRSAGIEQTADHWVGSETKAQASFVADQAVHAYRYFYSPTCPGCRAMRATLDEVLLPGEAYNVADEVGYAQAVAEEILSTPHVVALDANGKELWRTGDPREAAARFGMVAQTA